MHSIWEFNLIKFINNYRYFGIMSIVVKAQIKDVAENFNIAGDFADELDKKVRELIKEAASRAEANGRRTIMAKDL